MADLATSGTMVAAVLESAGYLYQSYLLDELTPAFRGTLGGFVYVIGIAVAIFAFAARGNYRLTAWLLIGPPLFFSFILPRTTVPEVEWKFARQDRRQDEVVREVQRISQQAGIAGTANVSTLFAKYNKLISESTQEIAKIINTDKKDSDKLFIFKGQLFGQMFSKTVEQPDFRDYVYSVFFTQCGRYIDAARDIGDRNAPPEKKAAAQEIMKKFDDRVIKLTPGAARYTAMQIQQGIGAIGLGLGTYKELEFITNAQRQRVFTCREIWRGVHGGLRSYGYRVVKTLRDTAEANDIDADVFMQQLGKAALANENASLNELAEVAAKYILRNELFHGSQSGIVNYIADSGRQAQNVEVNPEDDPTQVERARVAQTEWAELSRMLQNASNLPYYQGLGLFFLAIAFPFFAILLLVPGKHPAVILWFLLWLWVKSWDIGYAVAMQIDDILFSIFAFMKEPNPGHERINSDLALTIAGLHNTDPTFSMTTYYAIMATLLYAIPVITSQLILGGLTGGAGVISSGMQNASDWFAQSTQAWSNQLPARNLRFDSQDNVLARSQSYWDSKAYGTGQLQKGPDGALTEKTNNAGILSREERARFASGTPAERQQLMGTYMNAQTNASRISGNIAGVDRASDTASRFGSGILLNDGRGPTGASYQSRFDWAEMHQRATAALRAISKPDIATSDGLVFGTGSTHRRGLNGWQKFQGAIGLAAGAGAKIDQAYIDKELAILGAEATADIAWSLYDEMYSLETQNLGAQSRLYGILEVPWAPPSGGIQESDRELVEWRQQMKVIEAYLSAFEDVARGLPKDAAGRAKHDQDKEYLDKAQEMLRKNNVPEDVIEKLDFFNPQFRENMDDIFKADGSGLQNLSNRIWENIGQRKKP